MTKVATNTAQNDGKKLGLKVAHGEGSLLHNKVWKGLTKHWGKQLIALQHLLVVCPNKIHPKYVRYKPKLQLKKVISVQQQLNTCERFGCREKEDVTRIYVATASSDLRFQRSAHHTQEGTELCFFYDLLAISG